MKNKIIISNRIVMENLANSWGIKAVKIVLN